MGVLANGFIGATGVFQTWGATVLNNAYPSTTWANFARKDALDYSKSFGSCDTKATYEVRFNSRSF